MSRTVTEREVSIDFLKGFEYTFRIKVRKAENPTHHTDNPWTLDQISKVALFILLCSGDEFQNTTPHFEMPEAPRTR